MPENNPLGKLGKYELLEKIGEGGYGAVYHGYDTKMGRQVAIKILHSQLTVSPEFIERFRREALLASSLRHPHIITVTDLDEQGGQYFLVMDYLPGGSLEKLLVEGKPLSLNKAVDLLAPLASALDFAHSKNIIHRDIKPSNVMFTTDGQPVLTDFGLVKSTIEPSSTTTGAVMGTAEYMAPEQIRGKEVGPSTDLYALGVVAFRMLTGSVPFKGITPFEIQNGHVNIPLPDPLSHNPNLPVQVTVALKRALAKNPAERYLTGQEFIAALKQVSDQYMEQQATQLLMDARDNIDNLHYEVAIEQLQQLLAMKQVAEAEKMLLECQHRQEVWKKVTQLKNQYANALSELKELAVFEPWLASHTEFSEQPLILPGKKDEASNQERNTHIPLPETIKKNVFLNISIGVTLVSLVLALIILLTLPSPRYSLHVDEWPYQYPLSPNLTGISLGFVFVLWIAWLIFYRKDIFFKLNVGLTIIASIISLLFIFTLPNPGHDILVGGKLYQYPISPYILGFLMVLVLVLWAFWILIRTFNK